MHVLEIGAAAVTLSVGRKCCRGGGVEQQQRRGHTRQPAGSDEKAAGRARLTQCCAAVTGPAGPGRT